MAGTIDLAEEFLECLSHLEPADSTKPFALFQAQKNPPNPGICLKNGGTIGLPLSDGDAAVFRAAATSQKLERERPTGWVIPASEFELQNPAWAPFLQEIVSKVSAGLGVDSTGRGVSAELRDISLYDPSQIYTSTASTTPRTFAILTITLPSKYEGGQVRVSHGETQIIEASNFSAFDASFLAWFSDVNHELKPISSGRRLVLTYDLTHATLGPDILSAGSNRSMGKLNTLFSYWKEHVEEEPSAFFSLLKKDLRGEKLSYNGLEGEDLQVVKHLRDAGEKHGFCIYLASMKRWIPLNEEDDYDDFGYERELDQSEAQSILERVVELDGTEVAKGMEFDDEMLFQQDAFDEPDDEDSVNVFYHRTVVLFMPKKYQLDYFLTPSFPQVMKTHWGMAEEVGTRYAPDVTGWVNRLSDSLKKSGDCDNRKDLERICNMVLEPMQAWRKDESQGGSGKPAPFNSDDIAAIVVGYVVLDNKERFLQAFEMCAEKIPARTVKAVAIASLRYGLESLFPKLSGYVSLLDELSDRLDAINQVEEGFEEESQRTGVVNVKYKEWAFTEKDRAISSAKVAIKSPKDGAALANYCCRNSRREDIMNKVLSVVKRTNSFPTVTIAFLLAVFDAKNEGHVSLDIARTIFGNVMADLSNNFSLLSLGAFVLPDPPVRSSWQYGSSRRPTPVFDEARSHDVALLIGYCQMLQLPSDLSLILSKLVEEAKIIKREWIELTFLKIFGSTIQRLNIPVEGQPSQNLFQRILSTYLERHVQSEPKPAQDWSRPPVACDCHECASVNEFLANPKEKVGHFKRNGDIRKHISSSIYSTGMGEYTDKSTKTPYPLVLTKNMKYFEGEHRAWSERCRIAKSKLQAIDSEIDLRPFLADLYTPIITLSLLSAQNLRHMPTTSPGSASGSENLKIQGPHQAKALASISNNMQGSRHLPSSSSVMLSSGTKRKAEEDLMGQPKKKMPEFIIIDD